MLRFVGSAGVARLRVGSNRPLDSVVEVFGLSRCLRWSLRLRDGFERKNDEVANVPEVARNLALLRELVRDEARDAEEACVPGARRACGHRALRRHQLELLLEKRRFD